MNTSRGFVLLGLILTVIIGLVVLGGAGHVFTRQNEIPSSVDSGSVTEPSKTETVSIPVSQNQNPTNIEQAVRVYANTGLGFSLVIPQGWKVTESLEESPSLVGISSSDFVRNDSLDVIKGSIIQIEMGGHADLSASSPQSFVDQGLASERSVPGKIKEPVQTTLAGSSAVLAVFHPFGNKEVVHSISALHGGQIFVLSMVSAPESAFSESTLTIWDQAIQSFKFTK